jgi:hypothetical protein
MIQAYLKAGYPVLLVRPHEPERFIGSACQEANGRTPYQWDGAGYPAGGQPAQEAANLNRGKVREDLDAN